MEKDIEILVSFIKLLEIYEDEELKQAIENLINRVKELEEKDELVKYCRGTLPKDTIAIMMCNDDFCRNFGNDFISKDKIKEKIEEYNNKLDIQDNSLYTLYTFKQVVGTWINILQELLEEQEDK